MNRREFLKSLAAAGVVAATPVKLMAEAAADVADYGWQDMGDGWFRIWKTTKRSRSAYEFKLLFGDSAMHVGGGYETPVLTNSTLMYSDNDVGEEELVAASGHNLLTHSDARAAKWTAENAFDARMPQVEMHDDNCTFSCYVKGEEVEKALGMICIKA